MRSTTPQEAVPSSRPHALVHATDSGLEPDWWRQAVVYEIYPRSFCDLDGDGVGDIVGITSRVEYLAGLGVDAVWLTPFYPSQLADGGYDVADYRSVDPRLGNLRHFCQMIDAFHGRGIRVFIDIVPNHSSDQHAWFQAALADGPGSAARDRYIFRDGRGPHGEEPPNDWPSHWGPSCWTRVPDGQWYLHLFAPEQPDLNWEHPDVRQDFLATLRFWAGLGVDGFRVDVAHGLVKDLSEPFAHLPGLQPEYIPADGSHPLFDRDGLLEVYAGWRAVLDSFDPPLVAVGEVGAPLSRRHRYTSSTALHQAFNFELLETPWDVRVFRSVIAETLEFAGATGSSSTWVLSNHDVVRHASRYGLPAGTDPNLWLLNGGQDPHEDRTLGLRRARAAVLLLLALPGSAYLYQGEELGLFEVADIPTDSLQDPIWERSLHRTRGRDGCRVPLPWTRSGPSHGFGPAAPHLPQPGWFADAAVSEQDGVPGSTLELYRSALRLRRSLRCDERLTWDAEADVRLLSFVRPNGWRSVTNFSDVALPAPPGRLLLASDDIRAGLLAPNSTAWFQA